jgi:HSP20 family protein
MNTTRLPSLFAPETFTLDDAFRSFMRPYRWETTPELPPIRIDVTETDAEYRVQADLPGVRKEDIHVEIEGAQVMITVETKKEPPAAAEGRVLRTERVFGFATRLFSLGHEIDRTKAVAKYLDGVLTLTLPKLEPAHAQAIVVQ